CPKEHRPDLKEAFEKDENHEYYKALYEQEFMKFLKRLVDQMESRIKKVQQRIDANNTVTELDKDTAEKVNAVNAQISELLKKQDEAGAK
ncbi:putative alternative splicing type 3 and, partial [Toxoplasma gondii TgCatPRC2]